MTKLKALLAKKGSNKGFTLMEMIIVIAIIAILIALIAPNLISYLNTANETKVKANAKVCYTSANAWVAQQKVKGLSVGPATGTATITYSGGGDGKGTKSNMSNDITDLDSSIGADTWATGDTCVLTFEDGVCKKAVYSTTEISATKNPDACTYPTPKKSD